MFNESALIKYDSTIVSLSRGQPACVEFNFEKLWNFKRFLGSSFNPDLLSFYHVHPGNFLWYSEMDKNCLHGFNMAFGFPVFFGIICFNSDELYDYPYSEISFRLIDGQMVKQDNFSRFDLKLSYQDIWLLKGASFSEIIE